MLRYVQRLFKLLRLRRSGGSVSSNRSFGGSSSSRRAPLRTGGLDDALRVLNDLRSKDDQMMFFESSVLAEQSEHAPCLASSERRP